MRKHGRRADQRQPKTKVAFLSACYTTDRHGDLSVVLALYVLTVRMAQTMIKSHTCHKYFRW